MPLFIEILKRTPPWVFALFLVLLALGCIQSRNRTVGRRRLLLLSIAMLTLSYYGVVAAFGVTQGQVKQFASIRSLVAG